MKNELTNYLISSCVVVALLACCVDKSLEIQTEMLPGKYCFNEVNNNDSLLLFDNKSYVHKYILSETEVIESKSKWHYDSITAEISFYDFVFYNEKGAANLPGIWYSKVHLTTEGEVRLIYSKENGIFNYKK